MVKNKIISEKERLIYDIKLEKLKERYEKERTIKTQSVILSGLSSFSFLGILLQNYFNKIQVTSLNSFLIALFYLFLSLLLFFLVSYIMYQLFYKVMPKIINKKELQGFDDLEKEINKW